MTGTLFYGFSIRGKTHCDFRGANVGNKIESTKKAGDFHKPPARLIHILLIQSDPVTETQKPIDKVIVTINRFFMVKPAKNRIKLSFSAENGAKIMRSIKSTKFSAKKIILPLPINIIFVPKIPFSLSQLALLPSFSLPIPGAPA